MLEEGTPEDSTHVHRAIKRGVVFLYIVGTQLGKFIVGQEFFPPHFLKVSQTLKQRGVGSLPMGFLAALCICASDAVRWKREEHLTRENDRDLLTKDRRIQLAIAWDNNDGDATQRFQSAVHNAMIGATGHEQLEASDEALVLGPEEAWLPKEELTLEMLLKGRDPKAHDKTINDWFDLLHTTVAG